MEIHKIAVVGSREYPLRSAVEEFVGRLNPLTNVLISGGARGVDQWAAEAARERNIRVVEYRPNYKKYGRGAPLRRNTEIVLGADSVAAFWDGTSRGTWDTIRKSIRKGLVTMTVGPDGFIIPGLTFTEEMAQEVREAQTAAMHQMASSLKEKTRG